MEKKKKKKTIEIGDHVKEVVAIKGGKKRCGEVLMILQDDPGDPTCECMQVNPDDLTPLEKGSDGIQMFKTKRSKLKHYTPRKQLFTKKTFEKGDVIQHKLVGLCGMAALYVLFTPMDCIRHRMRKVTTERTYSNVWKLIKNLVCFR